MWADCHPAGVFRLGGLLARRRENLIILPGNGDAELIADVGFHEAHAHLLQAYVHLQLVEVGLSLRHAAAQLRDKLSRNRAEVLERPAPGSL